MPKMPDRRDARQLTVEATLQTLRLEEAASALRKTLMTSLKVWPILQGEELLERVADELHAGYQTVKAELDRLQELAGKIEARYENLKGGN